MAGYRDPHLGSLDGRAIVYDDHVAHKVLAHGHRPVRAHEHRKDALRGTAELVTGRSLRLPAQVQEPVELLWHISQLGHAPPDHAGRPTEQLDLEPVCQSLVALRTQHEIGCAGRPLRRRYEPDKLVPAGPERAIVHLKIRQPPVAELAHQQRALASAQVASLVSSSAM